jgi:gas vesicle protein
MHGNNWEGNEQVPQESDSSMCVAEKVTYFLAGAAAGCVAALLMAPWSGRELRGNIKRQVNVKKTEIQDGADYLKESALDMARSASKKAAEAVRSGQDLVQEGLNSARI